MLATAPTKAIATLGSLAVVGVAVIVALLLTNAGKESEAIAATNDLAGRGGEAFPVSDGSFTISGGVRGELSPGEEAPLNLSISNTTSFSLTVTRLTVTVRSVDAPNADARHPCRVRDFATSTARGRYRFTVRPEQTSGLKGLGVVRARWPGVEMLNTRANQDGCKAATLKLSYAGTARGSTS